ncbi:MAG: hypothetical protein BRD50_01330 [Bacteroidetes bacterium SW_11_45_7]|nr:MAG: hypothetical protein BRD50_01330 [Bacteroidetes bacterium SW_11_45_7]
MKNIPFARISDTSMGKLLLPTRIALLLLLPLSVLAQKGQYPQDAFRSPLDITLTLSGTFCEVRGNHFHSGVDFRTKERTGLDVYAVANGYVSRIKELPYGFGKAVYIDHPNGYTSVYAHIQEFSPRLEKYVEKRQYEQETFSIDLRPGKGGLPVRQGEVIAKSGNSGSSSGPHLHFEIRDKESQEPINPLYFGFDVRDDQSPVIWNAMVYNPGKGKFSSEPHELGLKRRKAGEYFIAGNPVEVNSRRIGFGVRTFDKSYGSGHYNGTYFLQLTVDGDTLYRFKGDRFAFYQTRYANAHIDYATKRKRGLTYQQLFLEPNDGFPAYSAPKNRGIVHLDDNEVHDVTISAMDQHGNRAELSFEVQYNGNKDLFSNEKVWYDQMIVPGRSATFAYDGINIQIPKGSVYDSVNLDYQRRASASYLYSPIHKIHNKTTPLHKHLTLQIQPNELPDVSRSKAVIVYRPEEGSSWRSKGGEWHNNYLQTKTRAFGQYAVKIDTIPPKVRPVNFRPYQTISSKRKLKVKIDDHLAGIDSYRAEVDGNWLLMAYDAKNDLLTYTMDEHFPEGEHKFKLIVKDQVGNETIFKTKLTK